MRVPIGVGLESRDGTLTKDAKILNGIVEQRGVDPSGAPILRVRKRPGNADLGLVKAGTAQLLYAWNGLNAVHNDFLDSGTPSTIVAAKSYPTTWNPSDKGADVTLSNGNLTASFIATVNIMVRATTSKATLGKFYWEVTIGAITGGFAPVVGIAKSTATLNNYLGQDANGWGYIGTSGNSTNNAVSVAYGATFTTGDVIGVALDVGGGTLTFYKNGVSQGIAYTGLSGTFFPAVSGATAGTQAVTVNFGATAFAYSVPAGYSAGLPSTGSSLGAVTPGLQLSAQETGPSVATPRLMLKNRSQAWVLNRSGTLSSVTYGGSMGSATYTLTSLTRSGTVATATLPTDPGFNVGDSVTIAGANPGTYNGAQTITGITPASFTAAIDIPITITRSGTTATATTASGTEHGLTSGVAYTIAGATQSAYNGSNTITVGSDLTKFTYTVSVTTFSAITGTFNPSDKAASVTLSGGNLSASITTSGATFGAVRGTVSKSAGQWAWEVTVNSVGYVCGIGISTSGQSLTANDEITTTAWVYQSNGAIWHNSSSISADSYTATDVIGVAFDGDADTVSFFKNGVYQGGFTGVTGTVFPHVSSLDGFASATSTFTANFAGSFTYNYDHPVSPAAGTITVTKPAVTVSPTFTFTIAGSPATPATGTITAQGLGGTVPGIPYIDGYFCVMDKSGVMWNSNQDDPTTWGALAFFTAQNEPGNGVALTKSINYLVALKDWTTEFYYDAKNPTGSPFSPVDPGFVRVGCASGDSVTNVDGLPTWISQAKDQPGRSVHVLQGLTPTKISTPDVERVLNADDLATVYAYGMKLEGHALYVLTLVTSRITLVFDFATKLWMQWSSLTLGSQKSVSAVGRGDDIATLTCTAHGLSDGDPVKISVASPAYSGIFPALVVDANTFTVKSSSVVALPDVATILAYPYTESYFKFTKAASYAGQTYLLHETDGHLYQASAALHQDAGIPIKTFGRSQRVDGGTLARKQMSHLRVVGDDIDDIVLVRWSDDDCTSFVGFRRVDLSETQPEVRKCGQFRRRSVEFQHVGNSALNLLAYEPEIS